MKQLLAITFLFLTFGLSAQTAEDFDKAGRQILRMVTDSVNLNGVQWITIKQYFEIIDKQPFTINQKALAKQKLNETFDGDLAKMKTELAELRESYAGEREDGATFEYTKTEYEPLMNSKDTYAVKTTYLYRSGKTETPISFDYELAWLDNTFLLISKIREVY